MKERKRRLARRGAAVLTALVLVLPLTGTEARGEETSDAPPTVLWLDGGYDTAIYLGDGVVETGIVSILEEKGGLSQSSINYLDLNSAVILSRKGLYNLVMSYEREGVNVTPQLMRGEGFYGGYMAVRHAEVDPEGKVTYRWGLLDPMGKMAVPMVYATEEEAWAQVGLSLPEFPYDYFPPDVNNDNLYGFVDENGTVLVDYQFNDAMPFTGQLYTRVTKDGRIGLLKDPRRREHISDWAKPEVTAALDAGLVPSRCQGYYTYEITRFQMAALLVQYAERTLGEELPLPEEHPFSDTRDESIEKAYAAGIVQGAGEGIFNPDKVVTREQLATMLYRTLTIVDPKEETQEPEPDGYEDFIDVSDWAREAVSALLAQGVIKGISRTRIAPKSFCTTEQAILLVSRLAADSQA